MAIDGDSRYQIDPIIEIINPRLIHEISNSSDSVN